VNQLLRINVSQKTSLKIGGSRLRGEKTEVAGNNHAMRMQPPSRPESSIRGEAKKDGTVPSKGFVRFFSRTSPQNDYKLILSREIKFVKFAALRFVGISCSP
jgi:hypothetical protein